MRQPDLFSLSKSDAKTDSATLTICSTYSRR